MVDKNGSATPSLASRAYAVLEEQIVTLVLKPGTFYSENELSQVCGFGRTPLREALQRLESDMLVEIVPRRGIRIAEINFQDYLALLDTRRVLDRLIAGQAAERAHPGQRAELENCCTKMAEAAKAQDIVMFMQLDSQCDQQLAEASRNVFAASASAQLHAHCRRFWYQHQNEGDLQASAANHIKMLKAVVAGETATAAKASDALVDYLVRHARASVGLT